MSGTEISRMRTKITASAPRPISSSRSGTAAGRTIPAARSPSRIRVSSPTKKTSLPRDPLCQPDTDSVRPLGSVPEYQLVNAEIVRTRPETHASRVPQLPTSGAVRSGRGGRCSGADRNGRAGSGVCTGAVWAKNPTGRALGAPSPRTKGRLQASSAAPNAGTARSCTATRAPRRPSEAVADAARGGNTFGTVSSLLDLESRNARVPAPSLAVLVRAVAAAAVSETSVEALQALAEAARTVCAAEIALLRAPDETGERLEAVAVSASEAVAAELEGTVLPAAELPGSTVDEVAQAPAAVRRVE